MSHHSSLKEKVLRGVYEDNAGIPRTDYGKRRSGNSKDPHGKGRKAVMVVLLVLISLFGINVRLTLDDSKGPAAMPAHDAVSLPPLPDTLFIAQKQRDSHQEIDRPAATDLAYMAGNDIVTVGDYDAMLTRLDMPMADLFDLKIGTIVIDPGHGGIDPGAMGHQGLMEKDVSLDIARRLRDKLARTGRYRVLLTRGEDRKVYLKERVAFAKDNNADLFISIHANALPSEASNINYVETFYFGPYSDKRTLEIAEKENHDSDYAIGDFRQIIAKIGDTMKTEESRDLANAIHRKLYSGLQSHNQDLIDAGSKTGPFVVLLGVEVPSVLVEVSCISNMAEETRLSKPEYRDDIADFLKMGIIDYLDQREHRSPREGGQINYVFKQER
ncbi:MAG: N-acetylmuramoyl-L-alanine amidase [Gammaproteobacteria bacterium]|jgi:N-acetylmuramoyl-L-alanine amidase